MINIDAGSFLLIITTAAVAGLIVTVLPPRLAPPVVVLEVILGMAIGRHGLGLAHGNGFIEFISNLGLGMLFFFAGYEIDFERVRGKPITLAGWGWAMSLALAFSIGGLLAATGLVLSYLYVGAALATTAVGMLIPMLRDEGELRTRFGTYILAAGAIGEMGPILLLTLVLSTQDPLKASLPLIAFIACAVVVAIASVRSAPRGMPLLERSIESSAQLAVRITALLVFGLAYMATQLGLDVVLGGFVAGMITRMAVRGHEVAVLDSKLTALGFGLLIPFFFIESGMDLNVGALVSNTRALIELPVFVIMFLVVRGTPAMLLYRDVLGLRDRFALACYSATALPLVVAISDVALDDGHMRPATATALVGAAVLSTLIFPFLGRALRRRSEIEALAPQVAGATPVGTA